MKNKLKFVRYFESFTQDILNSLIEEKKTYVRRKIKEDTTHPDKYTFYLAELKNYDVNKFEYKQYPYGIYIKPDKDFLDIIIEFNKLLETEIPLNMEFDLSLNKDKLNLIDFEQGVPNLLRGLNIGYKIYKLVIKHNYYITSNRYSTKNAYHIWYHLMLDQDLYCFTSNMDSGVIHKKTPDNIIKNVLEQLKGKDLIFDDELTQKIIQLYGSMDIYTQRN